MTEPIITRTLQSGKTLTICVETETRYPQAVVFVDGKQVGKNTPFGKAGDYRIICDGNAVLPITDAEFVALKSAIKANEAAPTLEEQRSKLVGKIADALEEQQDAFNRGHNSDGSAAEAARASAQPKVDTAKAALAEFDAAHPEIAEAARTKAAEAKARKQAETQSGFIARGLD